MPFGLSLSQIMDLGNEIPGLVDDVKKLTPKLVPLLNQAAATIDKVNKSGTLNDVRAAIDEAKGVLPDVVKTLGSAIQVLDHLEGLVIKADKDDLVGDVSKMVTQVQALLPELPALIAKVSHALTILGTSDTAEQAKTKIANTNWNHVVDRAGGVSSGGS